MKLNEASLATSIALLDFFIDSSGPDLTRSKVTLAGSFIQSMSLEFHGYENIEINHYETGTVNRAGSEWRELVTVTMVTWNSVALLVTMVTI